MDPALTNWIQVFNKLNRFDFSFDYSIHLEVFPEGHANFECVVNMNRHVLFKLQAQKEPLKFENALEELIVSDHFGVLRISKMQRFVIVMQRVSLPINVYLFNFSAFVLSHSFYIFGGHGWQQNLDLSLRENFLNRLRFEVSDQNSMPFLQNPTLFLLELF